MSDYLSNLATRSFNMTEVMQPRLAARFEPQLAVGEPISAQHLGLEQIDIAPTWDEIESSASGPDQPLTRPSVECHPESPPPSPDLPVFSDVPSQLLGGVTTTPSRHSEQLAGQQPLWPAPGVPQASETRSELPLNRCLPDSVPSSSLLSPTPISQPTGTQPPAWRASQEAGPVEPTPPPPAARAEVSGGLPPNAAEQENRPALAPAIQPHVSEPEALAAVPRPEALNDEMVAVPPQSAAKQAKQPVLIPAVRPLVSEQVTPPAMLQRATTSHETVAASSQHTAKQAKQPALILAIQPSVIEQPDPTVVPQPEATSDETAGRQPQYAAEQQHWSTSTPTAQSLVSEQDTPPAVPLPMAPPHSKPPLMWETGPLTPNTAVVWPRIVPYVEPTTQPTLAEPAATPEPTPTVQVTIGRVEVRAVPPPSPSPKLRRPASPVMSLDEYLRQRARGGGK
jgi:hypothetical protein